MKYLITGGCGFAGSNLGAEILKNGHELIILDNLYRYGSDDNLKWLRTQGKLIFFHADVRNSNDVDKIIRENKPDHIFHLAGQVAMTTSLLDPRIDFETNTLGTINLLEAVRKYSDHSSIIYSSTNKVYGNLGQYNYIESPTRYICTDKQEGFDEVTPIDFHSPYGCSKGAADQYVLDYNRMFGIKTIVFRHSSIYGGRQFATYDQGWIGWFCKQALDIKRGKLKAPFTIAGNGKQVRDVLHIDDLTKLYIKASQKIDSAEGHVFNIGGGNKNSLSIIELIKLLENILDVPLIYSNISARKDDQLVFIANIKKANSFLGWEPTISSTDGITKMLVWVNSILDT